MQITLKMHGEHAKYCLQDALIGWIIKNSHQLLLLWQQTSNEKEESISGIQKIIFHRLQGVQSPNQVQLET